LTHWSEIVGEEISSVSIPTKVSYKSDGLGATLTILTSGSSGPVLEMQKQFIKDKINAVYGYNAIHKIKITQSSPITLLRKNENSESIISENKKINVEISPSLEKAVSEIDDKNLRQALEELAINVFTKLGNSPSSER
tara:strand:- start:1395 stop:1808 length:414 start_codon:yes stop_codon:yes gene_type:complete